MKLTVKQEKFCQAYMELGCASNAYRRAYDASKMKPATVNRKAKELLDNGKVAARVKELREEVNERAMIDATYVLRRMVEIDEMDIADILTDEGNVKPILQWPKTWRTYLSSMEIAELIRGDDVIGVLKKIKWPDKLKNLEMLGKHLQVGAFVHKIDLTSGGEKIQFNNTMTAIEAAEAYQELMKND